MTTTIFLSMPTSDVNRSRKFYEALGWKISAEMSSENGICVVVSENIYFMLVERGFMQTLSEKPLADPSKTLQVQAGITVESRAAVDELIAKAVAAGGAETGQPEDVEYMYSRDFEDPDGNHFGAFYLVPSSDNT